MARTFPARFPGECTNCGWDFSTDDPIGYDTNDELCCEDCLPPDKGEQLDITELLGGVQ